MMNDDAAHRKIAELERRLAMLERHAGEQPVRPFVAPAGMTNPGTDTFRGIWGRINSSTRVGANWRWTYNITEMEPIIDSTGYLSTGWQVKTDGFTGTAYNFMELDNKQTGILGIGITVAELRDDPDNQCPFDLLPLPNTWIFPFWRVPRPRTGLSDFIEYWTNTPNGVQRDD